jgi:hypothetical protein
MKIVNQVGVEAEKYMLKCLLKDTDFKEDETAYSAKDKAKIQFLKQHIGLISSHSRFLYIFHQVGKDIKLKHKGG